MLVTLGLRAGAWAAGGAALGPRAEGRGQQSSPSRRAPVKSALRQRGAGVSRRWVLCTAAITPHPPFPCGRLDKGHLGAMPRKGHLGAMPRSLGKAISQSSKEEAVLQLQAWDIGGEKVVAQLHGEFLYTASFPMTPNTTVTLVINGVMSWAVTIL